jgi:hypothetical protein
MPCRYGAACGKVSARNLNGLLENLSVLCLRCMNGFTIELAAGPRERFLEHISEELIYRKELYARANTATTMLTAIVFVLIFFFYFY